MDSKPRFLACIALSALFLAATARADQIVLKNGTVYSGKFIRGDAKTVEFRILGRVESFSVAEIARIEFKEPELEKPAAAPAVVAPVAPVAAAPAATEPYAQQAKPDAPSPARSASTVTLPAGTLITVRTTTPIDTESSKVGDEFEAILDESLVSEGRTVIPEGADVTGMITYAKGSGKLTGQAELILELTEVVVNGRSYMLRTSDYTEVGSSRGKRTAATVGGTAAVGAIIGAIAGGGTGAAIGAASGAAVGTGVQVLTKGQVLKIPAETVLEFKLESPLTVEGP